MLELVCMLVQPSAVAMPPRRLLRRTPEKDQMRATRGGLDAAAAGSPDLPDKDQMRGEPTRAVAEPEPKYRGGEFAN